MKLQILERFTEGWYVLPEAIEPFLLALASHHQAQADGGSGPAMKMPNRPETDADGNARPQMEMDESAGLAIIPVHGMMVKGATGAEKYYYGVISHEDIEEDLDEAVAQGADKILLDIDSPGGTAIGTPELASKIEDLAESVNIFSYNRLCCASAAEYISAPCSCRFGYSSSINGSIGTMLQHVEISKMLEKFGVTVNLFTSGKYKGMGTPYKAMTDAQQEFLKEHVRMLGAEFADFMSTHRPSLTAEQMQGQTFTGKQAVAIGLLDQVVRSRAEVLSMIL